MARANDHHPVMRARCIAAHEFMDAAIAPSSGLETCNEGAAALESPTLLAPARRRRLLAATGAYDVTRDGSLVCSAPGCRPPGKTLARLGHDPHLAAIWLHVGPIERGTTQVVVHGSHETGPLPQTLAMRTPSEHLKYDGYLLDQLALLERPDDTESLVIASPFPSAARSSHDLKHSLYVVFARARRTEGGPGARWEAPLGKAADSYAEHLGVTMPNDNYAAYESAFSLITGRVGNGNGRPSLPLSDHEKRVVVEAEALYARHERRLTYPQIAATLGYDERRLRSFRSRARRLGFYDTDEYRRGLARERRKDGSP